MGYCSAHTSLLCAWCAHYLSISLIVVSFFLCIERREGTTLESAHLAERSMSVYKCVACCVRPSFVTRLVALRVASRRRGGSPGGGDWTGAAPVKTREWSSARSVIGAERTVTFFCPFFHRHRSQNCSCGFATVVA